MRLTRHFGHSVMGHTKDACGVFAEMLERGLQPSSHAYGALINGLIKDHKNKQGSIIWKEYRRKVLQPRLLFIQCL